MENQSLDLSGIDDWEDIKDRLETHGEEDPLELLLGILLKENQALEQEDFFNAPEFRKNPILTGVLNHKEDSDLFFLEDIYTLQWSHLKRNPYANRKNLNALVSGKIIELDGTRQPREHLPSGKRVLFLPSLGNLSCPTNLLCTHTIYTAEYLGIFDLAGDSSDLLQELRESARLPEPFRHTAEVFLHSLAPKKQALEELEQNLSEKNELLIQAETQLQEARQKQEALSQEAASLSLQLDASRKELDQTNQELHCKRQQLLDCLGPAEHTPEELTPLSELNLNTLARQLDYDYSKDILASFLAALSTTQIVTLFGRPGTGKTTFVSTIAKALGAKCTILSVQNNWTDSMDLMGYYNPTAQSFESTEFTEALLDAHRELLESEQSGQPSRLHIICLDEMNLSRVEYYFATFLDLLQRKPEERWLRLLPRQLQRAITADSNASKTLLRYQDFLLPSNVRFVGTINSDDTTNSLSPKVIDRCFFIELEPGKFTAPHRVELTHYVPASCLEPVPTEVPQTITTFFQGQNYRFQTYMTQMWPVFSSLLEAYDNTVPVFQKVLLTGKVLPAVRKEIEYSDPYKQLVPLNHSRLHNGYYDHLGDQA